MLGQWISPAEVQKKIQFYSGNFKKSESGDSTQKILFMNTGPTQTASLFRALDGTRCLLLDNMSL